jgi:hypothetical protein
VSAEAVPPPNPPDSLIYKLRYTPLADILRGRFTHRLDVVRTIAEASLPRPLSALVRETARRTRLWGRERVEVARELIAHFSDGLARGATAASLVRLFGDVGIAARLIRRAKKRNRPLGWRATAITVKICSAIIGIALLAYVAMVARLHSGSVRLSRNYSEEFNQRVRAIPAEQRAWPIYRQAYLALGSWPAGVDGREKPGAADWDLFVKFAESNREAIRLYREAAARPHLGAMLFDPDDRAVELKRPNYSPSDIALEPADNPPLMAASFNELTCIRDGARLLAIEAIAAIDDGDGPTAVQNIEAILRMAEHMAERGAVISALVASGTVMHAQAVVAHALSNAPGSLSDAQWTRVAHVLGGVFGSGSFPLPEEFELRSIQDVIQRVFTDDGAGDGHLAPTASEWMVDGVHFAWPDQPSPGRLGVRVMLPITSSIHVRRRPIQELYDDILRRGIQEARTPLWLVERYRVPVEVGSYRRGPNPAARRNARRHLPRTLPPQARRLPADARRPRAAVPSRCPARSLRRQADQVQARRWPAAALFRRREPRRRRGRPAESGHVTRGQSPCPRVDRAEPTAGRPGGAGEAARGLDSVAAD